ncbi:MAG TPA: type VI secretion system baseplate subunit TssF [Candidatus Acidoferrales bacterium]|jgi:type VI secretion system protein ImpG|nr:type VI secretion system baseplate subunit TssF [Candidatus Acidoferrales bacterium]
MRDDLLLYYERELTWLRQMGAQFADKYPKVASRLLIEPGKCEDPHVERLLEAFAFLAARVHLKVDDEFPEITQALLGIVYPHFIRPIPSMSIVEFQVDVEQGRLTSGLKIDKESMLYSRPVGGVPCKFRTCYDTTLWPLAVTAAAWTSPDRLQPALRAADAAHALRLELRSAPDTPFPKLGIDRLRFHLFGEGSMVHVLYELLCSKLTAVVVRDPSNPRLPPLTLPPSCVRPVGFAEDEGMLPYPRRSFSGYRLLQEYFAMPEKFLFVDVTGLDAAWGAGFKSTAELVFLISNAGSDDRRQRLEIGISPKTFRLGCTPIINLFPQTAEPLLMDQHKYEYPVIPDIRRPAATEVFSIDSVTSIDAATRETVTYQPFYSYRHETFQRQLECFWTASTRLSTRANDDALDVFLALVDRSMRPAFPSADTLTIRTTCSNRNLPARLPFGSEDTDFELETSAPIKRIVALKKPTVPLRPRTNKASLWQLVSHLSLNYLSLVSEGRDALQQILRLYDFTDSPVAQRMIEGIAALNSRPHFARLVSENGISFVRGTRVELALDEEQFVGGGVYLFASVIEQFLALYASLNSFTQLVATVRERKEVLREWPPRAGQNILI